MTKNTDIPTTALCRYTRDAIYYRDKNLVDELLVPNSDFVAVMMEHILGRKVLPSELSVMNAILISLMEHGLTPRALAPRSHERRVGKEGVRPRTTLWTPHSYKKNRSLNDQQVS